MPAKKRPKPLYQRGDYRLYRRPDRTNLEIVWYDTAAGRERSASAGTSADGEGRLALDKLYLKATGARVCEACGRPFDGEASPLLLRAITDYLLQREDSKGFKATKSRLAHAVEYVAQQDPTITCAQVDEPWVNGFRKWLAGRPVKVGKDGVRPRSLSHIEGCVLQLAAAINAAPGQKARFRNEQLTTVAASPKYRADVPMLAEMFRYCIETKGRSDREREVRRQERVQLLKYLRAAVATWARPEEIYDLRHGQWVPSARVLDLNPPGRRQTNKFRGQIPVPHQFAADLDAMSGSYLQVDTIRHGWDGMRKAIGLPKERGEAGYKLVRRSMATIVRRIIGEAVWRQGEIMMGHERAAISDIYAIPDPANLGLALAATEQVIDQIEAIVPGAFSSPLTAGRSRSDSRVDTSD